MAQIKGFFGEAEAGYKAFVVRLYTVPQRVIAFPNDGN